jgi:hypothetical protein
MNEELKQRSEDYGWEYSGNIVAFNEAEQEALATGYIQGAIDQDPISRKAEHKEQFQRILNFIEIGTDLNEIRNILEKEIEALP